VLCGRAVRPSPRSAELAIVALLVVAGVWLRWVHLATPSLWWDEIVHIQIAEQPTVADVIRTAREGGMPGSGNAGAMPLDYVVLHAWLAATPAPAPEAFERHVRMPAFAFAVAALPLAWVLGRMLGGPAAGALALALLAGSIPHVLYAAEARFYSLWVLATLANLLAFAALVRAPTARRTAVFALVAVGFVLSGLYSVFPIAAELAVLALLALRAGRDGRLLAALGASGVAVAALLAVWITPTAVEWSYGRGTPAGTIADAVENAFRTYAGSTPWLAVVFGASLVVAPIVARRDRTAGALATVFALSALAIPVIVTIARAKQYYFHPRHALFLLPMVQLATALVVGRAIDRLVRNPPAAALTGAALGLLATLAVARAYVANPLPFFRVTKTLRDYRGLTRLVAARTADAPPGWRWLLLLDKRGPGHLANPTVAFYLDRWGLADRVTLAGVEDPEAAATTLATRCATWCRGRVGMELHAAFDAQDPFDQARQMRRLLALRPPARADDLLGVGVVAWTAPPPKAAGVRATRLDGLTLVEPAAQGPP
jgi:hypothetical protein